uniref:POTRA domain-containing protein n=1 Tax=Paulinella longichromatophora TaxID=1708747 RepID=A0A2H4ZNY7_9EUKA|nr:hypothetical protein PLO_231 [Paulinella longichromatophora]
MLMLSRLNMNSQQLFISFWRFLVLSSMTTGLGILIIRHQSQAEAVHQLIINQEGTINPNQIIRIVGRESLLSLIGIDSREIKQKLLAKLLVEKIHFSQLIKPSRLQIELTNQVPIAWGERFISKSVEQGLVGTYGQWISLNKINCWDYKNIQIRIKGWHNFHQASIAEILDNRKDLTDLLKEIHIDAEGIIWLVLANMGPLRFGFPDDSLSIKVRMLKQLSYNLPIKLKGHRSEFIDMSCLEQPEISFIDE